jgi:hypothetical protein
MRNAKKGWTKEEKALGIRNYERVSWKTLAKIYYACKPGSVERRIINRECMRCGYKPETVLTLALAR